jgi:hypothetical protein
MLIYLKDILGDRGDDPTGAQVEAAVRKARADARAAQGHHRRAVDVQVPRGGLGLGACAIRIIQQRTRRSLAFDGPCSSVDPHPHLERPERWISGPY